MDPNAATTSSFRSHSGPLRKAAATSSFSGPLFQHRPLILQPAAAGSRTLMDLSRRLDLARSSLRTRDLGPLRPHRRLPAVDAATHALSTEAEAFFAVSAVVTVREKLEGFCEVSYENQASAPAAPPPPPPPPVGYWESQVWKPPAVATPKSITLKKPVSREERDDAATEAEAVRASSDRVMVWDQLKSSSFQVNEEMIETLFGCNAANAAASVAPIAQNGEQSA